MGRSANKLSPKGTLDDYCFRAMPPCQETGTARCAWHLASGVEHLTPTDWTVDSGFAAESSLELNGLFEWGSIFN